MNRAKLRIPRRFRGPPDSANGGYACGRLAGILGGPASVRLHAPPPLEQDMAVIETDRGLEARWQDTVVASAWPGGPDLVAPVVPTADQVADASARYAGFQSHWCPGCFVCGPERAAGDGLRIFAGPLAGSSLVAAPWLPGTDLGDGAGRVRPEFLWAALDCPGAFAITPSSGQTILLGELSAQIHDSVGVGEACTVVAWSVASEGRKHRVGTALYGADGDCRAVAAAVWIELAG